MAVTPWGGPTKVSPHFRPDECPTHAEDGTHRDNDSAQRQRDDTGPWGKVEPSQAGRAPCSQKGKPRAPRSLKDSHADSDQQRNGSPGEISAALLIDRGATRVNTGAYELIRNSFQRKDGRRL